MSSHPYVLASSLSLAALMMTLHQAVTYAAEVVVEPIQACIIARDVELNPLSRRQIAQCLGWQDTNNYSLCHGAYQPLEVSGLVEGEEVRIKADAVSFYQAGRSELSGDVEVEQAGRVVNAQTAYVYRDAKSNEVTKIELLGEVRYLEPDRLMIARKATIDPRDKSGKVEDVLYRFNSQRHGAILPAWGQASFIERFANQDYLLSKATYSNCAPEDRAWQIEADSIHLDKADAIGVARNAKLRIGGWPVFYSPYFSFPTSKERKSGFLMPVVGSSNVGGFDYAQPYYWNIAPNYDATLIPHFYSRRGLMLGGQFRYLSPNSRGMINGRYLPKDRAYKDFLIDNQAQYPYLNGKKTDRWLVEVANSTLLYPNLHLGIDFQQVSDDYYLQDFSSNLAILTERQLLRQGDLSYTTEHWFFRGMLQSYQTLHPINETPISDVYQRLPQLLARGNYDDLPFNGNLRLLGQYDQFRWPGNTRTGLVPFFLRNSSAPRAYRPEGPRFHFNPVLSLPQMRPWGYVTPSVEVVENYYDVNNIAYKNNTLFNQRNYYRPGLGYFTDQHFNRTIPRYSIDSGLYFERSTHFMNTALTQTLEPRLYYLYVPYRNQSAIPVYDSGYMIFNTDQLFRKNRFSGFDRIADGNQLAYAVSSRWLSDAQGREKASLTVGQIRYFANRQVGLCQSYKGNCIDNPLNLGYLSPLAQSSPIASRGVYRFNSAWGVTGDYVWDPYTSATNNGQLNFHYQPGLNQIISVGYTYLVNGDITQVARSRVQDNALHQATFAYAWPFNEKWSTLGAYNYNISKGYGMTSLLGVQYDSCCWAVRMIGGRTFRNLNTALNPRYNNNIYLQILLKGLGSAGNSDPSSTIHTFIRGYSDNFHS